MLLDKEEATTIWQSALELHTCHYRLTITGGILLQMSPRYNKLHVPVVYQLHPAPSYKYVNKQSSRESTLVYIMLKTKRTYYNTPPKASIMYGCNRCEQNYLFIC